MKLTFTSLFFVILMIACSKTNYDSSNKNTSEITYDSLKAQDYGADKYGMKKYVMAFLKKGPNRSSDKNKALELQKQHLDNISRLAEEGKLVLAGPFLDTGAIRGIYIFNVQTIKEAKELTNTDPAIKAGSLTMELKEWYGSAALIELNSIHKTLQKNDISE